MTFQLGKRRVVRWAVRGGAAAWCLAAAAALAAEEQGLDRYLPFDKPSVEALRRHDNRLVLGHHHIFPPGFNEVDWNDYYTRNWVNPRGTEGAHDHAPYGGYMRQRPVPIPVREAENWKFLNNVDDVKLAVAMGLDGFIVNLVSPAGDAHWRWKQAVSVIEAAYAADPEFKIIVGADCVCAYREPDAGMLVDLVKALQAFPNILRLDGKLVLSAWGAQRHPGAYWREVLDAIRGAGLEVAFIPCTHGFWIETDNGKTWLENNAGLCDGLMDSAVSCSYEQARDCHGTAEHVKALGIDRWVETIRAQDLRHSVSWDAANTRLLRETWDIAIRELGPRDWAQLFTWNDFKESAIRPATGSQYAFYDLCAYYITWFKTGTQPDITRDVLYYCHRTQSLGAEIDPTWKDAPSRVISGSSRRPAQPFDEIELLAFLTAPGELQISVGAAAGRRAAEAGITSFTIPVAEGTPEFKLVRDGSTAIHMRSKWTVSNEIIYDNHLYYAGSSTRERNLLRHPAAEALRERLVVEWHGNETYGVYARDGSGHGHHARFTRFSDIRHAAGVHGNAVWFAPPNDGARYICTAPAPALHLPEFTACLWVHALGSVKGRLLEGGAVRTDWLLDAADGALRFRVVDGTSAVTVTAPGPLPADRWSHVAVSRGASELRLYIDGRRVASGAVPAGARPPPPGPRRLMAGAGYEGALDEVHLYRGVLDEAAIGAVRDATGPLPGGQAGQPL